MSAGAYRGYGATQGIFALESAVDELAHKMKMDPVVFREKNLSKEWLPVYRVRRKPMGDQLYSG